MKIQILAVLLLTGCASKIIVDPKSSTNPANYFADKVECENISEQVSYVDEMAKASAMQALVSAVLSAALASKSNNINVSNVAKIGAVTGGSVGAGKGAYDTLQRRDAIVRKCLTGRGYKILE